MRAGGRAQRHADRDGQMEREREEGEGGEEGEKDKEGERKRDGECTGGVGSKSPGRLPRNSSLRR